MERKLLIMLAITALGVGCGDDASNNANSSNTNSNANSSANNSQQGSWSASVTGAPVEFPDASGGAVVVMKIGTTVQIAAPNTNSISMMIQIPVDGDLEAKTYAPQLFNIAYADPNYNCVGAAGFMVTITSTAPVKGTFAGPLSCTNPTDSSDMIEATASGSFAETF